MFDSWTELGYNVDGFDLPAEDDATQESQSREAWPSFEDLAQERYEQDYTVVLPDLNCMYFFFFLFLRNCSRTSRKRLMTNITTYHSVEELCQ